MFFKEADQYVITIKYLGILSKYGEKGLYTGLDADFMRKHNLPDSHDFISLKSFEGIKDEDRDDYIQELINNFQIISQCEPAHARKIFPCVDEPSFKSIFKLSVFV